MKISRTHSQTHARPDEKMGRRHIWGYKGLIIGSWSGKFKRTEKKQASRKRRQHGRKVSEEQSDNAR